MKTKPHIVKARVWEWEGKGAWHFVTIETEQAKEIKEDWPWPRRGFGSIPVKATIGKTTWKTSIFPENKGAYLLPIKKEVRNNENILAEQTISIKIEVVA